MTSLKTKLSITVYGNDAVEVEESALEYLSKYFNTSEATDLDSVLDIELLVQTRPFDDEQSDKTFKATVYASIKRNAVNFAR